MDGKARIEKIKQTFFKHLEQNKKGMISISENDVFWLIQQAETVEKYENFISACRYAGEGGLPLLRKEAWEVLKQA